MECRHTVALPWVVLGLTLASCAAPDALCDTPGCEFSREEWAHLETLANPGPPPADPSNKYELVPAAAALGQKLYFDPGFAGRATGVDILGRPVPYGRASTGSPARVSCATCHALARAGTDGTSKPDNISVGAGWYHTHAPKTVNAVYQTLFFWDGRADNLWQEAAIEAERPVAMNGNRLAIAWRLGDGYLAAHDAAFADAPLALPFRLGSAAYAQSLGVVTDPSSPDFNQCARVGGACPSGCSEQTHPATGQKRCWPPFPLAGKPGQKAGCQAGDATEPFDDAFDCMGAADKKTVNGTFVHFTKALAAYERLLVSKDSAFDRFITEGPLSSALTSAAKRGARLFVGKASCLECHQGKLLTTGGLYQMGIPQVGPGVPTDADCPAGATCDCTVGKNCWPWGAYEGLKQLQASNTFRRDGPWSDDVTDTSRSEWYTRSIDEDLIGSWKTPSLRDVALTAPYMHDGVYRTLDEVVRHYNQGGASAGFPGTKSRQLIPLHLSEAELSDLVVFLQSLTGAPLPQELVTAPTGLPPP